MPVGSSSSHGVFQRPAESSHSVGSLFIAGCSIEPRRNLQQQPGTPIVPIHAAAVNGLPNLSMLDGWWVEACEEGITGWAIGEDGSQSTEHARSLYDKLETAILPLWYRDRSGWIRLMKQCIARIGGHFHSQRMMRRYAAEAYLR